MLIWSGIALGGVAAWLAYDLPDPREAAVLTRKPSLTVVAADGRDIASFGDLQGVAVPVAEMPPYLPAAAIAIEDRRFYSHWGVDPVGLLRALWINATAGRVVQGGSTITQQVAKNLFLTPERTLRRKGQEALLALWLEYRFSKAEILSIYLNRVYLGAGTYGVDAAAKRYFGHGARDVTLLEAAILAGLPKAPSRLNPAHDPDAAVARARLVLSAMQRDGVISGSHYEAAVADSRMGLSGTNPVGLHTMASGRHFADWVVDHVADFIGPVDSDLLVHTTLDPALQSMAETILSRTLNTHGAEWGVSQGAIVVMDTTGAIKALVGGRQSQRSGFNRAVQAKRQPGSAFKPIVFLTGLEAGMTPDMPVVDEPIRINGWSPTNYSGRFDGMMTLQEALAQSVNTVAVRIGEQVGRQQVIQTARRLGVTARLEPKPSLSLGVFEMSLLELVAAYGPFASGGFALRPHGIVSITDTRGQVLHHRDVPDPPRVVAPSIAAAMDQMLLATAYHGTARGASLTGIPARGKTGTSQDYRDAWFVGYANGVLAGVWLGNDDGSATNDVTGGGAPVQLWREVMEYVPY